ncbi:MAG: SRPBCC domain-containing protein, partial [Ktedonobacteraceae bacterium]
MDHTQRDLQHVLKISRIIHAPRQEVFEAWTTAESVKQWMCPEGASVSF